MKLLVTGGTGLLGSEVVVRAGSAGHAVVAPPRAEMDVTDAATVHATLERVRPDAVIHCAAYTAVDGAEAEPELAMAVNRDGTHELAVAAARLGAHLTYVSTDYVFDGRGRTPYRPSDPTRPLSAYGESKLAGEIAAREPGGKVLIARTSWVFGATRRCFLTAMLERAAAGAPLTVVDGEVGGPSWSRDVAAMLVGLVERGAEGVWHTSNVGGCTRVELIREALCIAGLGAEVTPTTPEAWGAPAERPTYSVLDVSGTQELLETPIPDWSDAVSRFLDTWSTTAEGTP